MKKLNFILTLLFLLQLGFSETITIEAESMDHSTGGPTNGGWNIWSNGNISTNYNFTNAVEITVVAKGSMAAGVWPNMLVSIGGVVIGETSANSTNWESYVFSVPNNVSGQQIIQIIFDNDLNAPPEDRNLYVDKFIIEFDAGGGGGGEPPTQVGSVISSLPVIIDQPGTYYFNQDLTYTGTTRSAIKIETDNVIIDFKGYTLTGSGKEIEENQIGVYSSSNDRISILNGVIKDFPNNAIWISSGNVCKIENMIISDIGSIAILAINKSCKLKDINVTRSSTGILLVNGFISESHIFENTGTGIHAERSIIKNLIVEDNDYEGIEAIQSILIDNLEINNGT